MKHDRTVWLDRAHSIEPFDCELFSDFRIHINLALGTTELEGKDRTVSSRRVEKFAHQQLGVHSKLVHIYSAPITGTSSRGRGEYPNTTQETKLKANSEVDLHFLQGPGSSHGIFLDSLTFYAQHALIIPQAPAPRITSPSGPSLSTAPGEHHMLRR
ncbi:hypothetical protein SODALDRAFT_364143 [Sodiomyces alkalinus F11]|uniref:Uncharacterized protein n=1 Tax=Sodiomyces alkalinus (strain CBS 110278 / VKM F-3762 / F11) TaxID=1314773 RepID=A0A3N2PJT7_SODAK|nr:hypothetical protein SODALDRAFT_364143 [Sodiomyces alkalinus F11]ROT34644.1 hypothetical protein SODALDRAFT_364143 [Sodiomyces alkalinus F11]